MFKLIKVGMEPNNTVNVLMILKEEEKDLPSTQGYVRKVLHIFEDNVESISKLYYTGDNIDEEELIEILLEDYFRWIRPYEYGYNFIFDPHGILNDDIQFKLWEEDTPGWTMINLKD